MDSFSKKVNEEMRSGRGQVVDGYQMPPAHAAINDWIRRGAAKNTWETTPDGKITLRDGEPVNEA